MKKPPDRTAHPGLAAGKQNTGNRRRRRAEGRARARRAGPRAGPGPGGRAGLFTRESVPTGTATPEILEQQGLGTRCGENQPKLNSGSPNCRDPAANGASGWQPHQIRRQMEEERGLGQAAFSERAGLGCQALPRGTSSGERRSRLVSRGGPRRGGRARLLANTGRLPAERLLGAKAGKASGVSEGSAEFQSQRNGINTNPVPVPALPAHVLPNENRKPGPCGRPQIEGQSGTSRTETDKAAPD